MAMKIRKKKSQTVFGLPLEEVLSVYGQDSNTLPIVLAEIITYLKKNGLGTEKIFIRNGNDVTIQLLKKLYNKDGSVPLDKYSQSITSIAWLLRIFLAELPDPLLTKKFGSTFLKTQTNPDSLLRYRNLRKLLSALPAVNRTILRALLELFRLILHHRRTNKLTMTEFCSELGPILLGIDKNTNSCDATIAGDVLKTLITQFHYLIGNAEEPADWDTLPLYTKKSRHKLTASKSRAHLLLSKSRINSLSASSSTSDPNTPPPEESVVSLTDAIMGRFLDLSIRAVLFEPQVRISFNYEAKIPNHLKRNYTTDKLMENHKVAERANKADSESRAHWRRMSEADDGTGSGTYNAALAASARSRKKEGDSLEKSEEQFVKTRRNTTTARDEKRLSSILDENDLGGDVDGSSSSASSKRRSRRISINEDLLTESERKALQKVDELSQSSNSDHVNHSKRHSVSNLDIPNLDSDDSDSDPEMIEGSKSARGPRRVKSPDRRSSTSKITTAHRSKLGGTGKERRTKSTKSVHRMSFDGGNRTGDEEGTTPPLPNPLDKAYIKTKPRTKSISKAPMDSKTIMENAPSPPKDPPPLVNLS